MVGTSATKPEISAIDTNVNMVSAKLVFAVVHLNRFSSLLRDSLFRAMTAHSKLVIILRLFDQFAFCLKSFYGG